MTDNQSTEVLLSNTQIMFKLYYILNKSKNDSIISVIIYYVSILFLFLFYFIQYTGIISVTIYTFIQYIIYTIY